MRTIYSVDASMDVAREVASASISIPVKEAWNSASTTCIETGAGVVEGPGVGCRGWVRPVGSDVFPSPGQPQASAAGREDDRRSRSTLDIPPRLGSDFASRLSESSLQCNNLDFLLAGCEGLDTRLSTTLLFFTSEDGLPDRMITRFFVRFVPRLPRADSLFVFLSVLDPPVSSQVLGGFEFVNGDRMDEGPSCLRAVSTVAPGLAVCCPG